MGDPETGNGRASVDDVDRELYVALQRRLLIVEGREPSARQEVGAATRQPTRGKLQPAPQGQGAADARQRLASPRPGSLYSSAAGGGSGCATEGKQRWRTAQPFSPVKYALEEKAASSGESPASCPSAERILKAASPGRSLASCPGAARSLEARAAAEVFDIMGGDEGTPDSGKGLVDDYDAALGLFACDAEARPADLGAAGSRSNIVSWIDLAEADMECTSMCSTLEAQVTGREPLSLAPAAVGVESPEKEREYLQQRLADCFAERDIQVSVAREEAAARERAAEALERRSSGLEESSCGLKRQLSAAISQAEKWRQEAAQLRASGEDLRRASRSALKALDTNVPAALNAAPRRPKATEAVA